MTSLDCACSALQPIREPSGIEEFIRVRSVCPALQKVFVPEDIWPRFEAWHRRRPDSSLHRSILFLAAQRGCLARLTSPVHRFLLRGDEIHERISSQYRRDLQERWVLESDPTERHRRARIFLGRLAELLVAEWLDSQGWAVTGLEALGAASDIEATAPSEHASTSFEVKFIGEDDTCFDMLVRAVNGQPKGWCASPYDAANYPLYRAYEAARQLQRVSNARRIAVLVIDGLSWSNFDVQLLEGWIDWLSPSFHDTDSWRAFAATQGSKYPRSSKELAAALQSVDAVWVLRWDCRHVLSEEFVREFDRA
ncbi:MAG: hypothetical protein QMD96_00085 [Anaerosomatales bacterium]|nr:hypothetical protein [Anaerosomatales bacterium]